MQIEDKTNQEIKSSICATGTTRDTRAWGLRPFKILFVILLQCYVISFWGTGRTRNKGGKNTGKYR